MFLNFYYYFVWINDLIVPFTIWRQMCSNVNIRNLEKFLVLRENKRQKVSSFVLFCLLDNENFRHHEFLQQTIGDKILFLI